MRKLRILAADNPAQTAQRFEPSTAVNNREPLFWPALERTRFEQVPNEARARYAFALCGLRFSGPTVSFYIKPVDGFQLPEIMQWIKQTYAVRYNVHDGRTGHIWGDRYASRIAAGGPPEDAKEYVFAPAVCAAGRRTRARKEAGGGRGGAKRGAAPDNPARDAKGRPRTGRRAVKPPPQPDPPAAPPPHTANQPG
jgi:hypothetical protein